MPRNGSGTYILPTNSWNPATNGNSATAADWQSLINDVESAVTQSVSADGQTPLTGNLNANNNKITNLAAGSATGDSLRWQQLFSQGANTQVLSAATVDIGAQNTNFIEITGTTTITSLGANYNGPRFLRFTGILILTHNATTLNLPGGVNVTTAAGDTCIAIPNSTPNGWNIVQYQKANLSPGVADSASVATTATNIGAASLNNLTTVTFDPAADFVAIADGSDSGNAKKALIAGVALLTGDQTIAGVKTFSSAPVLQAGATFGSATLANVSTSAPLFGARAFGVFDGRTTGTFAANNSGNVSSITRNSAGDYTVTLSTAMGTTDYAVIASARNTSVATYAIWEGEDNTTTTFRITTKQEASGFIDCAYVGFAVFRT